ncbi:protein Niban 1a isoform X2 [Vanacampus margaritifer]
MGITASSLLDEAKCTYITEQAEAKLEEFSPYYRKQFSVAWFSQLEDELEQQKENITHLLKQRESPEVGEVLYEDSVFLFDDSGKWKKRYLVVRANYCFECHESLETFLKGTPPHHKLLPTGGNVVTTEEKYTAIVDECFPDDNDSMDNFAPPLSAMPGQFPVYLRMPYRRDSYFCFYQQAKQLKFLSILSDCIRHQNQDFLKKKTCEVQAFLKAVQLYRQDKGKYEAWDMLIGSDVRVLANLVMEHLLPSLQKEMVPYLKAKKTGKKRLWFETVEAAYVLVQEHLLGGLSALKEQCRKSLRQQEVLIHSDMDQILNCRQQLEEKVRAIVAMSAEKVCATSIQPHLGSVLEELMQPISSGFLEGRQLSESLMDSVCYNFQKGMDNQQFKQAMAHMARPELQCCYQKIASLQGKVLFGFSNMIGVIYSSQIDLQQLIENSAYTFELLLSKTIQDNQDNAGALIEKAKHRVLKQYDYDSSTVRKRIFQEALVAISLPFIKKNLAPACKPELQGLERSVDNDYSNFVDVENVYESILLQTLDKEVTKVVKEAVFLRKYNLFTNTGDHYSRSSTASPSVSTLESPDEELLSFTKNTQISSLSSVPTMEEKEEDISSGAVEKMRAPEYRDGAFKTETVTLDTAALTPHVPEDINVTGTQDTEIFTEMPRAHLSLELKLNNTGSQEADLTSTDTKSANLDTKQSKQFVLPYQLLTTQTEKSSCQLVIEGSSKEATLAAPYGGEKAVLSHTNTCLCLDLKTEDAAQVAGPNLSANLGKSPAILDNHAHVENLKTQTH